MASNKMKFSDLFSWRRTTSGQKIISVGLILFALSFVTGFWSVCVIYFLALPLSWKLTQITLNRNHPVPSDRLLLFIQSINRVKHAICSMINGKGDVRQTRNKHSKNVADNGEFDIGRAKHVSHMKGQTVSGEVKIFVKYVVRDFVQSWYEEFSHDTQTLKESQQVLHIVADNLTKRGQKIHPQRLSTDLIKLYSQHLYTFQIAKSVFQTQRKGSSSVDPSSEESIECIFDRKIGFHAALKNEESETNFLRSLSKLMLLHIIPPNIDNCNSSIVMLTEILACNVLNNAINMMTDPDWLYESMIILMTDDEPSQADAKQLSVDNSQDKKHSTQEMSNSTTALQFTEESNKSDSIDSTEAKVVSVIPEIRLEDFDNQDSCDSENPKKEESVVIEPAEDSIVSNADRNNDCNNIDKESSVPPSSDPHDQTDSACNQDTQTSLVMSSDNITMTTDTPQEQSCQKDMKENENGKNLSNHVSKSKPDPISDPLPVPKKTGSTSSLFSIFRRKESRADSTRSTSSVTSTQSDEYYRPRSNTQEEVFREEEKNDDMQAVSGVEYSEEAVPPSGEAVVQFGLGEKKEDESGEEKEIEDIVYDDSSLMFQDVSVPVTEEHNEYRSTSKYTLYTIEYNALYFTDGPPVLKSGSVKRRFREFVNLQSRMENNSSYKKLLKDVKGPSRWNTLPFKNMDKESVETRRLFLEKYVKSLIGIEAICNGPELREFLAYEGDGHIAFVKRAPEISVPRLDKMLAKTVSGVFEKIKSIPEIPQNVLSAVTKRDKSVERLDSVKPNEDTDRLDIQYSCNDDDMDQVSSECLQSLEEFIRVTEYTTEEEEATSELSESFVREKEILLKEIQARLPRSQGDGSEVPGKLPSEGQGQMVHDLPIANAVFDLVLQTIQGHEHWLTREKILSMTRITVGKALDRWLSDKIAFLTTPERWVYYSQLLREVIWPDGELSTETKPIKSQIDIDETRQKAKMSLMEFFPDLFPQLVGAECYEDAAEEVMQSLEHRKINKHMLFMFLEILAERLFPEIPAQDLREQLFT